MKKRGFTLIELLVVISIISLLSSIVLAGLNSARQKALISKAKQEMLQFVNAATIAQGESSKTLLTITGSGCSDCPCRSGDMKNTTGACYTAWLNVLSVVQGATNGIVSGLTNMQRDPWGSPYALDENQGEGGDCTRADSFMSLGPNGTYGNSDDVVSPRAIPFSPKCP